jgi:hypothetical protein
LDALRASMTGYIFCSWIEEEMLSHPCGNMFVDLYLVICCGG